MKIIYLAAFKAEHPGYDIVYQDINGKRDLDGDMLDIDLEPYDIIIATPPCNYWSRANWRRNTSEYSLKTKHLLPCILEKLIKIDKPFIVENVRNSKMFKENGLFDLPLYIYEYGRHTYWTNILFNPNNVKQVFDDIQNLSKNNRQGSQNVHNIIEHWLNIVLN